MHSFETSSTARAFLPLALMLTALAGPGCQGRAEPGALDGREANALEFAYIYFAADIGRAEICEKIDPEANLAAPLGGRGHQVSYAKSECYFNLALAQRDRRHCEKVTAANTFFLSGNSVSRRECRNQVDRGLPPQSSGGDYDLLMTHMGFPEDQISSVDYEDRCFQYAGVADYHHLGKIPDEFSLRIRFLPDFAAGEPEIDRLLAEARAHDLDYRRRHINRRNKHGMTALNLASYRGNVDCVSYLLELGASLGTDPESATSVLVDAAGGGHVAMVELWLDGGMNAAMLDHNGRSPIHAAARNGHVAVIERLVQAGVDVDLPEGEDGTALWWSTARGHEAAAIRLIELGADPRAKDDDIVFQAVQHNSLATLKRLLDAGASLEINDEHGQTPLHSAAFYAVTHANSDTLRFLLEQGVPVNARALNGLTPLHHAARGGKTAAFTMLLAHGADLTARDNAGRRPIDDAQRLLSTVIRERQPVSELTLLLGMGASPHETASAGSLLHVAVNARNPDAVVQLLAHGVDPRRRNRADKTPLDLALLATGNLDHRYGGHPCEITPNDTKACHEAAKTQYAEFVEQSQVLQQIIRLLRPS